MKIIRTEKYMKIAGIDPRYIGQAALGVAMTAREDFGRSFPALEKVGSMLSSRGRADSEAISGAIDEIRMMFNLRKTTSGALSEGYYGTLDKLSEWLFHIKEQQDLEEQRLTSPYDLDGTGENK